MDQGRGFINCQPCKPSFNTTGYHIPIRVQRKGSHILLPASQVPSIHTTQKSTNIKTVACFDGGNFILAGLTLKQQKYVDFGLSLVNGCHNTYSSTLTKLGPESFRWTTFPNLNPTTNPPPPTGQAAFYAKAGFYISNGAYILRPEVIESFYYAFRATGDQKYRDWAWEAFVAINETCRVGSGFAGVSNVNAEKGGGYQDFQESFLFAEVMKYSYLIHAPVSILLSSLWCDNWKRVGSNANCLIG
jgi:hypothetical protein